MSAARAPDDRRNLVLLTIDAWRPDFVDEHAGVALAPSLRDVAARTVRFDRAYANGPWTTPALVSVFSGESPARHGVHFEWSAPRPGGQALARALRDAGYCVPNLCYLNRLDNYANLGFDKADAPDYPHTPADDLLTPALHAARTGAAVAGAPLREPFFLWFHYKFVHLPYWPAETFRRALGVDDAALHPRLRESVCTGFVVPRQQFRFVPEEDRAPVRRLYAAGVLQMDAWLAGVLDALHAGDGALAARTTLVVTADHGEELLDHGHVGHASTAHHAQLHEEVLRIPLLVVDARVRGGPRRVGLRVQGMDLFPTLLSLAGVAPPPAAGLDLAPLVVDPAATPPAGSDARPFYFHAARMGCPTPRTHAGQYVEGVSDGRSKVIVERYDETRTLLYDLTRDPEERDPETDGDCAAVEAAVAALDTTRTALAAGRKPAA